MSNPIITEYVANVMPTTNQKRHELSKQPSHLIRYYCDLVKTKPQIEVKSHFKNYFISKNLNYTRAFFS